MIKMAYRNLFRNWKRTFLTAMVVCIGIAGVIIGLSWIGGISNLFINEGIRLSGEVRIAAIDYELKEKTLDTSSNISYEKMEEITKDINEINQALGRIKFGGVVYGENEEEKALGFGIQKEDYEYSGLKEYIYEGRFLDFNNNGEIIVGNKIRKDLNLNIGDVVTVLTSTQNRSISAMNYEVKGFYKMENSRLNRNIYITLDEAQYLLDMDGKISEYLLFLKDRDKSLEIAKKLESKYGNSYLIQPWNEVGFNAYFSKALPFVRSILAGILGILCGVAIANTMMMIVFERRKEIGILKASGMTNKSIISLFCIEGGTIGLMGSLLGSLLGGSVAYYFSKNGIVIGDVLENISDQVNVTSVVYTDFSKLLILKAIFLGIIISLLATFGSITPEVRKRPVENMRKE